MAELKLFPLNLTKGTDELKRLISEHPDYPIVVLAGEEANSGDYNWMFCSYVQFEVTEILDFECPYEDEVVCTDREEFAERFEEWLWDEMCDESEAGFDPKEEEFQARLKAELAKFEPYWKKVIAITASN